MIGVGFPVFSVSRSSAIHVSKPDLSTFRVQYLVEETMLCLLKTPTSSNQLIVLD